MSDNQEEKIRERFKQIRNEMRLNQPEFAELTGIKQSYISAMESGKRNITSAIKITLEDKIGINRQWLETGDGEIFIENSNLVNANQTPYRKKQQSNAISIGEIHLDEDESPYIDLGNDQFLMVVPLVPIRASLGYREHYNDEQYIQQNYDKHYFPVSRQYRGKYYAFVVDGDSMDNGTSESIIEGSTVTARDIKKELWKSKFHLHSFKDFVIVMADAIIVKRIIEHDTDEGTIVCHSLNPDKRKYKDFTLKLDDCLQIMNIVNVTQPR